MIGHRNSTRIFLWIAVFLWMVLIFNLSSQMAEQSDGLSSGIAETVMEIIEKVAPLLMLQGRLSVFQDIWV
ncbi:MAG: hypothetical protein WBJ17_04780 [Natronincolaceae bacterium]